MCIIDNDVYFKKKFTDEELDVGDLKHDLLFPSTSTLTS